MGLVTSFGSFGQFALVPVTQIFMTEHGWQFARYVVGAVGIDDCGHPWPAFLAGRASPPVEGTVLTGAALRQATSSRDYFC